MIYVKPHIDFVENLVSQGFLKVIEKKYTESSISITFVCLIASNLRSRLNAHARKHGLKLNIIHELGLGHTFTLSKQ